MNIDIKDGSGLMAMGLFFALLTFFQLLSPSATERAVRSCIRMGGIPLIETHAWRQDDMLGCEFPD